MHGLDQELDEFETGIDALESSDEFEWLGEADQEWTGESDGEAVFDEVEEMELAAELLGLQSEEELEEFLGKLISKAAGAVKGFANSTAGKAVGGVLKNVARVGLPIAGKVLGNMVLPGVGGMIGGKLAGVAGKMFGLELEGMSPQDQEFEVARRFVRLGGEAARQAARMGPQGSPVYAAKDAVLSAARVHAPGLVGGGCACGCKKSGASLATRRPTPRTAGYGRAPASQGRGAGYGRSSGGYGRTAAAGGYRGPAAGGGYPATAAGGYAAPRRRSRSRGYGGASAQGGYAGYGTAAPGGYAGVAGAQGGYAAAGSGGGTGSRGTWVRRGNLLIVRLGA